MYEYFENLGWAVVGGLVSLLIAHGYFRKSLSTQAEETERILAKVSHIEQEQRVSSAAQSHQSRIAEAMQEYRRAGTPVKVIDTYADMTNEEKADLLDSVLMLARGRKAKTNKYRTTT